jgi:hypothetical protein
MAKWIQGNFPLAGFNKVPLFYKPCFITAKGDAMSDPE